MNIRLLNRPTERITQNLDNWSRRLKIPLATKQTPIEAAIIIGDGTPDDIVWLILTHKLNGKQTIGLTKPPGWSGLSSINAIPTLIKGEKIKSVIVAVDQETNTLEDVWREAEKSLKERGIGFEVVERGKRIYVFACTYANYEFKTLIVVNGVDKQIYRRHTIEDHLLEFCKESLGADLDTLLNESEGDPKEAWRRLKDKEEHIYQQLLTSGKTEHIFTQHVAALRFLQTPPS